MIRIFRCDRKNPKNYLNTLSLCKFLSWFKLKIKNNTAQICTLKSLFAKSRMLFATIAIRATKLFRSYCVSRRPELFYFSNDSHVEKPCKRCQQNGPSALNLNPVIGSCKCVGGVIQKLCLHPLQVYIVD